MSSPSDSRLRKLLLGVMPADGESVGNTKLKELFDAEAESQGYKVNEAEFEKAREALIIKGTLLRGKP